tara:strand:+ start:835 stop:942 length:108 start_codon:yes stop_codon:yes gene_type:complete
MEEEENGVPIDENQDDQFEDDEIEYDIFYKKTDIA